MNEIFKKCIHFKTARIKVGAVALPVQWLITWLYYYFCVCPALIHHIGHNKIYLVYVIHTFQYDWEEREIGTGRLWMLANWKKMNNFIWKIPLIHLNWICFIVFYFLFIFLLLVIIVIFRYRADYLVVFMVLHLKRTHQIRTPPNILFFIKK